MRKMELMGIRLDWESYERAQKERWELVGHEIYHCKVHDTYFTDNPDNGEPCWRCYDEFQEELN